MTREIYTHLTDRMRREAAEAIEQVVADLDLNGFRGNNDAGDEEGRER